MQIYPETVFSLQTRRFLYRVYRLSIEVCTSSADYSNQPSYSNKSHSINTWCTVITLVVAVLVLQFPIIFTTFNNWFIPLSLLPSYGTSPLSNGIPFLVREGYFQTVFMRFGSAWNCLKKQVTDRQLRVTRVIADVLTAKHLRRQNILNLTQDLWDFLT